MKKTVKKHEEDYLHIRKGVFLGLMQFPLYVTGSTAFSLINLVLRPFYFLWARSLGMSVFDNFQPGASLEEIYVKVHASTKR